MFKLFYNVNDGGEIMEALSLKQQYLKLIDRHKAILMKKLDDLKSLDNDPFVKEIVKSQFYYMYKDCMAFFPDAEVSNESIKK